MYTVYRPDQAEKRSKQLAKADSPLVTTDAIEHALFDPQPHTRYAVANFDGLPGECWCLSGKRTLCLAQKNLRRLQCSPH